MKEILIDTHVFIYWLSNNTTLLGPNSRALLSSPANTVYVSSAVPWEISIKVARGSINFSGPITQNIYLCGFKPLSITPDHAEFAGALNPIHKDPFDRVMIAQSMLEGFDFMTRDRTIPQYTKIYSSLSLIDAST